MFALVMALEDASAFVVRIVGISGELCSFRLEEVEEPRLLWNVATDIKRLLGIRRGGQRIFLEDEELCFQDPLPQCDGNEIVLTLVRTTIRCDCCNRKEKKRRYKLCSNCMMARYCNLICQEIHWRSQHKLTCRKAAGDDNA